MNILLDQIMQHADPTQVEGLMRFFKTGPGQYGYGDKFLGIKVPVTRGVVKECWQKVSFDNLEECVTSQYHEIRLAALLTLIEIFSHSKKNPDDRAAGMKRTGTIMMIITTGMRCTDSIRIISAVTVRIS